MAFSPQTYRLKINLENGVFIDRNNMPTQPSGFIRSVPPLWANQSFELVFRCVEDNADVKADFTGATAKLYIKIYNDDDIPVELATGTLSESATGQGYDTVTFLVPRNTLSTSYADPSVPCLLYAEIYTADRLTVIAQIVTVTSPSGNSQTDSPLTNISYTTTATLTGVNGRQWVFCTTTGGSWVLTLPSAASYPLAEFWIIKTVAANTLTITPAGSQTINGSTDSKTISTRWGTLCVKSDGSNWVTPIMAQA